MSRLEQAKRQLAELDEAEKRLAELEAKQRAERQRFDAMLGEAKAKLEELRGEIKLMRRRVGAVSRGQLEKEIDRGERKAKRQNTEDTEGAEEHRGGGVVGGRAALAR